MRADRAMANDGHPLYEHDALLETNLSDISIGGAMCPLTMKAVAGE